MTKYDPNGTPIYSTYLGGTSRFGDVGNAIAVDAAGSAYLTGMATSSDFPITPTTAIKPTLAPPAFDAFMTKINPNVAGLASLVYSTFLGSDNAGGVDIGNRIAVDAAGNAYIGGQTSGGFDGSMGAYQQKFQSVPNDGFVAKIDPTRVGMDGLRYYTFLGAPVLPPGTSDDHVDAIAVDAAGDAYVTGLTVPNCFGPCTPTQLFPTKNAFQGVTSMFVTELNPGGTDLVRSSFLGGVGAEEGHAIAVDGNGGTYIAGETSSTMFPHGERLPLP